MLVGFVTKFGMICGTAVETAAYVTEGENSQSMFIGRKESFFSVIISFHNMPKGYICTQ